MKYTETTYNGTVEFLAADDFVAIPGCVTESVLVKAGTPLTAAGKGASTGTNAIGIVLYDTDPAVNPNCALLVQGVIDLTKMNTHSGLELTAAQIAAVLPGIICRTNIGVNS